MDAEIMDSQTVESKDILLEKIGSKLDILAEILVLLPLQSIFSLLCVSRRWRNILKHPSFLWRYSADRRCRRSVGGRVLAFFQRATNPNPMELAGKHCNTLRIGSNKIIKEIPKNLGYFINSSNGLILCSREESPAIYHVVNPVTGKYVSLPPPPNRYLPKSTGIMCEENTTDLAPIYTVVRAGLYKYNTVYVDTYSSITGEWSDLRLLTSERNSTIWLRRRSPVVANGVFHWYSMERRVAVYDPKDSENHVQLIDLPDFCLTYDSYVITRSPHDLLLFGTSNRKRMKFYMLPKGEDGGYKRETTINRDEWVLMYDINLDSLYQDINILTASKKIINLESIIFSPWNSQIVAVIRLGKEVCFYSLESKSIETVEYYGCYSDQYYDGCFGYDNSLCPYIESSFLSSYAL